MVVLKHSWQNQNLLESHCGELSGKQEPVRFLEIYEIKQKLKKYFYITGNIYSNINISKLLSFLNIIDEAEIKHRASESTTLREKCLYSEFFILNVGKYGPEKLRIKTLLTQCISQKKFGEAQDSPRLTHSIQLISFYTP